MRFPIRSAMAVTALSFLALACGPRQPQPQPPPAAPPGGTTTDDSSPFPPPPIEILPGGDKKIAWTYNGVQVSSTLAESSERLTDELAWKVQLFTVTDMNDMVHNNVQWASIMSGFTERAVIRRVGAQFHWTIAGNIPELCSRYDPDLPACANGPAKQNNSGIPASLFGFPDLKMRALWKNQDGTTTEAEVKKISLRGRTCPPYGS